MSATFHCTNRATGNKCVELSVPLFQLAWSTNFLKCRQAHHASEVAFSDFPFLFLRDLKYCAKPKWGFPGLLCQIEA
jgi:hypothetical protein